MSDDLSRRNFLGASAGILAASMAPFALGQTETKSPVPAIDTHVHFYDPTRPGGVPWPPPDDTLLYKPMLPGDYVKNFASTHNIAGVVVVEANAGVEDNLWVLDIAKDNPAIVGYIGRLDLGNMWFAPSFKRLSINPIFRGLRINNDALAPNFDKPEWQADFKRFVDGDYTLDISQGAGTAATVAKVRSKYPDLRIVIEHLPHRTWNGDPQAIENRYREIAALPHVYVKISEVLQLRDGKLIEDPGFYQPALEVLYKLFGPDRCVYGSNYPVSERLGTYGKVYKVVGDFFNAKGRDVAEKYFWRNSRELYKWVPRGSAAALR